MAGVISGRHWSVARVAASVLLLALAVIYAVVTALFVLLFSSSRSTSLRIGDDFIVLYSDLEYSKAVVFLALCLLSGYAGLAAIRGWRGARLVALAAGAATIALGSYGLWIYANALIGVPVLLFSIGIQAPPELFLVLCVAGILVLWAVQKPMDKNP